MRLSFLIFTENAKLNSRESPNCEIKYLQNVFFSNSEINYLNTFKVFLNSKQWPRKIEIRNILSELRIEDPVKHVLYSSMVL